MREICSSYLYLLNLKKIRPLEVFICLMHFITGQGGGARANSKLGEKSSLITILFSSTSLYYFENSARLKSLCANKSSIRQGENRPKEPNKQHNRNFTEATAAQINHDLVCAFTEVSAVYRFCYKVRPNLTVLKSCMMLSGSSIMVMCFGRDL